jgi:hypothetical protein
VRECFGQFSTISDCIDCQYFELCSSYYVAKENQGCPMFGRGFDKTSELCKCCTKYFVGSECKSRTLSRKRWKLR